jgi:single-stranded-DNA-specific exonuclease
MIRKWKVLPKIRASVKKKFSDYPSIIQQLLFNREIKTKKAAKNFLDTEFLKFYDPDKIYDIKKAAKIILSYIKKGKKFFIHGDFDVDGICATSILWDFLYRQMKADVLPYVPSRFDEGYGMSDKSIGNIKKQGGEVIITVDCGIKDDELIKKWSKKGLEFIVTDHHELKKNVKNAKNAKKGRNVKNVVLPDAMAIVHPQHPKSKYPFTEISGATVVWKLVSAIAKKAKLEIDPDIYLDLVALSAICDVMPLVDENRSIVKKGLEQIRKTQRKGLVRLIYDAGLEPKDIEAYHLGFVIGPRLNAAGRLDHAIDAIRLLTTKRSEQAREISEKLNRLNQKRQRIQEGIYNSAIEQIKESGLDQKLFFIWGDGWAEGVIGIVAGKICETFSRPVLVATKKEANYTGSARSIGAFNIINAINAQAPILERFGGHPLAAGFTVKAENIEQFRDNLLEVADRELSGEDIQKELIIDSEMILEDVTWEMFDSIEKFAPFGFGNLKPKFVLRKAELSNVSFVGAEGKHLKFSILNKKTGEYFGAIGFGLGEEFKDLKVGDRIDIAFTLDANEWNGERRLQLNVKDVKVVK